MTETHPSVGAAIEHSYRRLKGLSESPLLDAQVLVAYITDQTRTRIITHPEALLNRSQITLLQESLIKLESGVPLPYVIGRREFYGLEFTISPAVLIPRPETEHLVEVALKWLDRHPGDKKGIDIGSGSGCIAISIAKNRSNTFWIASDISLSALQIARMNVQRHLVNHNIKLVACNLMDGIRGTFDLICANLPYIPSGQLDSLKVSKSEPMWALDGGRDGLAHIRRLLQQSAAHLAVPGSVLLEIEASQGKAARETAKLHFPDAKITVLSDLAGHDRILQIESEVVQSDLHFRS